jgi:hypothetical protein
MCSRMRNSVVYGKRALGLVALAVLMQYANGSADACAVQYHYGWESRFAR